jgi:hypothetical protein
MYEFQSALFDTPTQLARAIAGEWLSAGGSNGPRFIENILLVCSDAELAEGAISCWGLAEIEDYEGKSWLDRRDLTRADIEGAFAALRPCWREELFAS